MSNTNFIIKNKKINEKFRNACKICGKLFTLMVNMEMHVKSVHKGQQLSCTFCTQRFTQIHNLTNHIKSAHEKNNNRLQMKKQNHVMFMRQGQGGNRNEMTNLWGE